MIKFHDLLLLLEFFLLEGSIISTSSHLVLASMLDHIKL